MPLALLPCSTNCPEALPGGGILRENAAEVLLDLLVALFSRLLPLHVTKDNLSVATGGHLADGSLLHQPGQHNTTHFLARLKGDTFPQGLARGAITIQYLPAQINCLIGKKKA